MSALPTFNQHCTRSSGQGDQVRKRNKRHPDWRTKQESYSYLHKENPEDPYPQKKNKKQLKLISSAKLQEGDNKCQALEVENNCQRVPGLLGGG